MYSNALAKHAFEILLNALKCNVPKCLNQMDLGLVPFSN